jgi:hypothetical protein
MNRDRISAMRPELFFAAFLALNSADASSCKPPVVEPVHELSVQKIGQLARQQSQSTSQYTVVLWNFDLEGGPRRGTMSAVAFVLVSTGDLGSEPVAAIIWMDEPTGGATLQKDGSDGFKIALGGARTNCTQSAVSIRMRADGVITADSTILGQLH